MEEVVRLSKPRELAHGADLKKSTMLGLGYEAIGFAGINVIRIFRSVLLAHLLTPSIFGLNTLLSSIIIGFNLLTDVGFQPLVAFRDEGDEPKYLDTIWTLQVVRGLILWLFIAALAMPFATIYQEESLLYLLPILGLTLLITSFQSTSVYRYYRYVDRQPIVAMNVSAELLSTIVTIAYAWFYPSIWALMLGAYVAAIIRLVMTFLYMPDYRPKLAIHREYLSGIFEWGKWVAGSTAFTFALNHGDKIALAAFFNLSFVGVYGIAASWAAMVWQVAERVVSQVFAPAWRQALEKSFERGQKAYYRSRTYLEWSMIFGAALFLVLGPQLIFLAYDERYHSAAAIMQVLSIAGITQMVGLMVRGFITANGLPKYQFYGNLASVAWLGLALPACYNVWGVAGCLWAFGLSQVPALLVFWFGGVKHQLIKPVLEVRVILPILAGLLIGYLIVNGVDEQAFFFGDVSTVATEVGR